MIPKPEVNIALPNVRPGARMAGLEILPLRDLPDEACETRVVYRIATHDRRTGEPITIDFDASIDVPEELHPAPSTEAHDGLARIIRTHLLHIVTHEVDEALSLNDVQPFDPHSPTGRS